jgi:hypothetical protein
MLITLNSHLPQLARTHTAALLGNPVADVAARRHAEPDNLSPATPSPTSDRRSHLPM